MRISTLTTYPGDNVGSVVSVLLSPVQSDGVAGTEAFPVEVSLADGRVGVHDTRNVDVVLVDLTQHCVHAVKLGFV